MAHNVSSLSLGVCPFSMNFVQSGPKRGGILPPGMKEKNTGIKAVDGEKTGIKAVDGEDDAGIKGKATGVKAVDGEDAVLGDMDALRGMTT